MTSLYRKIVSFLIKLEQQLALSYKRYVTVHLPVKYRKRVVEYVWIVALACGIFGILEVVSQWQAARKAEDLLETTKHFSRIYGGGLTIHTADVWYYAAILILLLAAIMCCLAVNNLLVRAKTGWNFVFYAILCMPVYAVLQFISRIGGGISGVILSLIITVTGLYILFQIRTYYGPQNDNKKE